jgi:tRNA nucleotidyltransferase (CCA-adding enzyme)
MQIFEVGGAVRDALLGRPVSDRDWVVVGATPQALIDQGFRPVGKDFPVFLHPHTHEEYALARTERKTAPGYSGFQFHASPEVTLEDDLARRDLTINAMARAADGTLIDPFNGLADLQQRVLRHVGEAFIEDPVRILRVARFAARFEDFTVAPATLALMQQMSANGEVDALVPERVWQEIARGLMEARPSRMIAVLRECGALKKILPEVDALFGVPQPPEHHPEIDTGEHVLQVIDVAAARGFDLPTRWAALTHDLGKALTPPSEWPRHHGHEGRGVPAVEALCARLKTPAECRDLAVLACREHGDLHRGLQLRADTLLRLLQRCDALRRPARFKALLDVCQCDSQGRTGRHALSWPPRARWEAALAAVQAVDAGAIARDISARGGEASRIAEQVQAARLAALEALRSGKDAQQ